MPVLYTTRSPFHGQRPEDARCPVHDKTLQPAAPGWGDCPEADCTVWRIA